MLLSLSVCVFVFCLTGWTAVVHSSAVFFLFGWGFFFTVNVLSFLFFTACVVDPLQGLFSPTSSSSTSVTAQANLYIYIENQIHFASATPLTTLAAWWLLLAFQCSERCVADWFRVSLPMKRETEALKQRVCTCVCTWVCNSHCLSAPLFTS